MSTLFCVREASRADAPAIAALMSELYRYEGYEVVAQADEVTSALFIDGREVALRALVAVDRGREIVIGALLFYPGYDTLSVSYGYHLADIIVTRRHRKSGVGTALVKALAAQTLAGKKEWISLTALQRNDAARGFYASLGMTQVAVDFYAMGKTSLVQLRLSAK